MKQRNQVVHDEEEASSVLAAVDMSVTETYPALFCLSAYVRSEALSKRGFARAHISSYYDSLRHFSLRMPNETEKLCEQTQFLVSVRELVGNIADVQLCFILEHALVLGHC
jgi:hypothetical protein